MNDETPDNPTPENPAAEPGPVTAPYWRFTLVMAEVIFKCELGIQTRRIQFVSKSNGDTFPRSRLVQLQSLAANNVVAELKSQSNGAIKEITVEAVYLLGNVDLGWMTEEDFFHSDTTLISAGEMPEADNDALPEGSNVVPLRTN